MLIDLATSKSFCKSLRGRKLDAVTLIRSGAVVDYGKEWWCWTGDHLIIVRYKEGILVLGVGETEHEAQHENTKVVATDAANKLNMSFNEIMDYMNWIYLDDVCMGES